MSKKDSTLLKKGQTWYVSKPPPPSNFVSRGIKLPIFTILWTYLNTGLWNNFLLNGKRNPDFLTQDNS